MSEELEPVEPKVAEPIIAEKLFVRPVVRTTGGGRLPQSLPYNLEYGPVDSGKQFQARIALKDIPEAFRQLLLDNGIPQLEAWLEGQ